MGGGNADKSRMHYGDDAGDSAAQSKQIGAKNAASADELTDFAVGPKSQARHFASGADLSKVSPEGTFRIGMDEANRTGSRTYLNMDRNINQDIDNRGFGVDAGAALSARRSNALNLGGMKAGNFATAAAAQHGEALDNFWKGTSAMTDTANATRNAGVTATGNAGQTYSNVYGNAAQYHQGAAAGIIGSAIGAAGAVGAAATGPGGAATAAGCPCSGGLMSTQGGEKPVQKLDGFESLEQIGVEFTSIKKKPTGILQPCVLVLAEGDGHQYSTRVSLTHSFVLSTGGYTFALGSLGSVVKMKYNRNAKITDVVDIGEQEVFPIHVNGGDHTYCCDGFWSLE